MSGSALADILKLIELHCPQLNFCTSGLYRFKKYFSEIQTPIQRLFFCSVRTTKLETKGSQRVSFQEKTFVSYFLHFPILEQLRRLFQRPGFVDSLKHRLNRTKEHESNYEYIYDWAVYKELVSGSFFKRVFDILFTWFTDGFSLFNLSNFSLCPFYLNINELPYTQRSKLENTILAGL